MPLGVFKMRVVVLGSGTSTGVPMIGCDCSVCTSTDPKNSRFRSSIAIMNDTGEWLIFDTPPEFRQQVIGAGIKKLKNVVYTHLHADHIFGFDDLRAFCFKGEDAVSCYVAEDCLEEFRERFGYAFYDTGYSGAKPKIVLKPIPSDPFSINGIHLEPIRLTHGNVMTTGFKIGKFAYFTDFKGFPKSFIREWKGRIDVALASGIHFGSHSAHNSVQETMQLFSDLGVKRGYITHLSHRIDYNRDSHRLYKNIEFAYDGLVLDL